MRHTELTDIFSLGNFYSYGDKIFLVVFHMLSRKNLNITAMEKAASYLIGTHDFRLHPDKTLKK